MTSVYSRGGAPPFGADFRGGPGPRGGRDGGQFGGAAPRDQWGGLVLPPAAPAGPPAQPVDREKTCPLLMRVFPKNGNHHLLEEFVARTPGADVGLPRDEIQIYTWMDATLRELSELVMEVQPAALGRQARLSFAFVYPDRRGKHVMRQVGSVHAHRRGEDDDKTLRSLNFQTGDYLDVAMFL